MDRQKTRRRGESSAFVWAMQRRRMYFTIGIAVIVSVIEREALSVDVDYLEVLVQVVRVGGRRPARSQFAGAEGHDCLS